MRLNIMVISPPGHITRMDVGLISQLAHFWNWPPVAKVYKFTPIFSPLYHSTQSTVQSDDEIVP